MEKSVYWQGYINKGRFAESISAFKLYLVASEGEQNQSSKKPRKLKKPGFSDNRYEKSIR